MCAACWLRRNERRRRIAPSGEGFPRVSRCIALLAMLLAGCGARPVADTPGPGFAAADSLIADAVSAETVPGAVLLVARGGKVIHKRAFGYAQLYAFGRQRLEAPEPMTVDHAFDLASLTKVLSTTMAVMMLVDRGQIDLDKAVGDYVDCFSGTARDSVTVRHLLTHTSGLFQWKPIYYHASSPDEAIEYICSLETAFPVGKQRRYSDLGFMLLGRIVEDVAGVTLDQFVQDELYGPLGLERTGYNPPESAGPFAATSHGNPFERRMVEDDDFGYDVDEDLAAFDAWRRYVLVGEVNDGNAYHAFDGVAGHAGLFSTADEIARLLHLVHAGGTLDGRRYFSSSVRDEFLRPNEDGTGLGWAMSATLIPLTEPAAGAFGHTGFTGTYAAGFPAFGASIVLLTNRQNGDVESDGRYPSVTSLRQGVVDLVVDALAENEPAASSGKVVYEHAPDLETDA